MNGHAVVVFVCPGESPDSVAIDKEMIFERVTTQYYFVLSAAFWPSREEMPAAALHLRRPLKLMYPENYF